MKKNKKMLVKSRLNFDMLKKMTTKEDFHNKFEVAMHVVAQVLAEETMVNLHFEDSRVPTSQEMIFIREELKSL